MYGLPEGVVALNEDPYNVGGQVAWYCSYPSPEVAADVVRTALEMGNPADIRKAVEEPSRARISWLFHGSTYVGDVLVDASLKPVGYWLEVHYGFMVFNLQGHHIPLPRFNDDDPAIRNLVY